jgi:hypothetical protein
MGELANPALKMVLAPMVIPALAVAATDVGVIPALVVKPALMVFNMSLAVAETPPDKVTAEVALFELL